MRKNELLTDAIAAIRAAGFEPRIIENRHFKVFWLDQYGRSQCLVVSKSASDRLARHRSRSILRRLLITAPDRISGIQKEMTT